MTVSQSHKLHDAEAGLFNFRFGKFNEPHSFNLNLVTLRARAELKLWIDKPASGQKNCY